MQNIIIGWWGRQRQKSLVELLVLMFISQWISQYIKQSSQLYFYCWNIDKVGQTQLGNYV